MKHLSAIKSIFIEHLRFDDGFLAELKTRKYLSIFYLVKNLKQLFLYQEMTAPTPSAPQSPRVNFNGNKSSQQRELTEEPNGDNTALREIKGENGKLLTNNNVDGELSSDCSHPTSGINMNILRFKALPSMQIPLSLYHQVLNQDIKFLVYPGCIRIKSRILPKLRLGRRYI